MPRVNRLAPRTTVELGGRERTLRFDIEALRLIREELDLDLLNDSKGLTELPLESVATVVWAALTHEDDELYAGGVPGEARELALFRVRRMIDFLNLEEVMTAMFAAFGMSMPEPKADAEVPDPNAPTPISTGSISGPMAASGSGSAKTTSGNSRRANSSRSSSSAAIETTGKIAASPS